jgi:hypothetical protein
VEHQLRRYQVKPGQMEAFVAAWRDGVVPLREAHGFTVVGAWVLESSYEFVWIVGHDDFVAADTAYYGSPERAALDPSPLSFLDRVEHWMMRPAV